MTASTISANVRGALATSLSGVAANVYGYVPEAVLPPAVVVIYDAPAMQPTIINDAAIKLQLNFVIAVAVNNNNNQASLDNLEQLIISVLAAMPAGYTVGNVERPSIVQVGASNLLVADIRVSTYYTQTN